MSLDELTAVPDEETVHQYVSILQNMDLRTGVTALVLLVVGVLLVKLMLKGVNRVLTRSGIPKNLHAMLRTTIRLFLYLVVILTVANYIGIPITSFVALLGLIGLAISLALQGLLGNVAGGLIILTSHPFEVGHFVEQDGISGTVREIRMMHTRLETPDGKMIYIPNSAVSAARVINFSETGRRRVDISVSASYDNPPDQVRKAVLCAVARTEGILPDPEPVVAVEAYGDSAIQYTVLVWVSGADFIRVKRALTEDLYSAFEENGVKMTYPHVNVHMN